MKVVIFFLVICFSQGAFCAMGYLGGHPFTQNTAERQAIFNEAPLPPPVGRRQQYVDAYEKPYVQDMASSDSPLGSDDGYDDAIDEDDYVYEEEGDVIDDPQEQEVVSTDPVEKDGEYIDFGDY